MVELVVAGVREQFELWSCSKDVLQYSTKTVDETAEEILRNVASSFTIDFSCFSLQHKME